jgi:hypothetical protein
MQTPLQIAYARRPSGSFAVANLSECRQEMPMTPKSETLVMVKQRFSQFPE